MSKYSGIPESKYGILIQDQFSSELEEVTEQVRRLGYAVLDSGLTSEQLREISDKFNLVREQYLKTWGESRLRSLNEIHTIRALLTQKEGEGFLQLAMNSNLMAVLHKLIVGTFILNQQNGIINPPGETYNQAAWHRDLPYQHFVSSTPLALNALFCLDDFNFENGSTFVLPASHMAKAFPSDNYLQSNALQVKAKAGQFILLDCMLFHSGGFNRTAKVRRAINHVYTIPYFKQQIDIPKNMQVENLSSEARALLGFNVQVPDSIESYLVSQSNKRGA
jgi:ectoine hydroxylase-related dioxygenase (phytanoyl-CoA dioxygenase family)